MTQPPNPPPEDDWGTPSGWGQPSSPTPPGPQQPPYGGPPGYQQPGYQQPGYPPAPSPYAAPAGGMPQTWLIPAILSTVLCCLPTGVAAIVFASQVTSKWNAGDVAGATLASNRAKVWTIVSVAAGALVAVVYVIGVLASSGDGGY